jgi:hypothetical protein
MGQKDSLGINKKRVSEDNSGKIGQSEQQWAGRTPSDRQDNSEQTGYHSDRRTSANKQEMIGQPGHQRTDRTRADRENSLDMTGQPVQYQQWKGNEEGIAVLLSTTERVWEGGGGEGDVTHSC